MMNFPEAPTIGQQYPAAPAPPSYVWDGEKWGPPAYPHFHVERAGDTMTGHLSLPTFPAADNAVRRDYVDVALSTAVLKSGDTMTGHLTLPTSPAADNAVRKDYVDAAMASVDLSSKVSKTGDTMTGTLSITGGDLRSYRAGGGTGVLYMSSGDNYLYWNGTNFQLSNELAVSGQVTGVGLKTTGDGDRMRWRGDTFSVISHQNNNDWYLMVTDSGNPDAGWNGLRPFRIGKDGNVGMAHGVSVGSLSSGPITSTTINMQGNTLSTGTVNASGNINFPGGYGGGRSYAYIGWQDNSQPAFLIYSGDPGWDCFMAFHRLNFATYFGLGTDNTLRWGGWSHGNNSWRLWSERDFGNPFAYGTPVVDGRMPFAGDPGVPYNSGPYEPYGGAVCTGMNGAAPVGYYVVQTFRMRYMQLKNANWWTIAYA